eukprot:14822115-Alexandrium_andersonii.AAC.1
MVACSPPYFSRHARWPRGPPQSPNRSTLSIALSASLRPWLAFPPEAPGARTKRQSSVRAKWVATNG